MVQGAKRNPPAAKPRRLSACTKPVVRSPRHAPANGGRCALRRNVRADGHLGSLTLALAVLCQQTLARTCMLRMRRSLVSLTSFVSWRLRSVSRFSLQRPALTAQVHTRAMTVSELVAPDHWNTRLVKQPGLTSGVGVAKT